MKKGIDVSAWQGNVDFNKVKNSGIEFVIMRAGCSQTVDAKFYENVEKCKKANLPVTGVYLFSYALNAAQAKAEARFAVNSVEKAGLGKDTIIFFDLEYDSIDYAKRNGITIAKNEVMTFTKAFCEEVTAAGYTAGIYFNNDFYNRFYDLELLNKYVKWLADWDDPLDHPCDFHQYSCKGRVPGIDGDVDLDYDRREENQNDTDRKPTAESNLEKIANEVIAGKWGNGDARKKALTEAGYNYNDVQAKVDELISGKKPTTTPEVPPTTNTPVATKSIDEIANEVVDGKWGNGDARKKALTDAGYNYNDVQAKVNEIIYGKQPTSQTSKTAQAIADEVIAGKWGNGEARKKALTDAGYNYAEIQKIVDEKLKKK